MSYSQSGWNYLPNAPVVNSRFDDLYFINDSTGWAVNGYGQIYKTQDYGDSWVLQLDSIQYYFRSVEFINDTVGFAGTLDNVVFKTTDAGANWFHIEQTFPQPVPGVCGIGHFGNTIIFEGIWDTPAYILRSDDGGVTWTYIDMSMFASGLIDCWFKNQDTVFVCGIGTNASNNHGIVLRSTDGGINWQQVGQSPVGATYGWKIQFTSDNIGYVSLDEQTTSASNILKTVDGGSTWNYIYVANNSIAMEGIGFLNDSVGWVGGWSSGMYQTTDGGQNWSYLNFGVNLNRFVFRDSTLAYAAGSSIYKFSGINTGIVSPQVSVNIHNLFVSPNPAINIVNFNLQINKNTSAIFEIYDENGRLINQFIKGELKKNNYSYSWNLTGISAGNYIAVLRTNEHFLTKKFVVK